MFTLISPFSILQDKGQRLEKNGKYQEAAEIYRELSETIIHQAYGESESKKAILQCAINLRRSGSDLELAMETFNELLCDPSNELIGQVMREKAMLLITCHKPDEAIQLLHQSFPYFFDSDNTGIGSVISAIAKANHQLGQEQKALRNFERADSLLFDRCNIHELDNIVWWMDLLKRKDRFRLKYRALKLSMKTGYSLRSLSS